jgi:alcohol dehydrogenase (quinone), cytochrome c subunit
VRGIVIGLIAVAIAAMLFVDFRSIREPPNNTQKLMRDGQALYIEYCAECHQTDGSGWSTLYPRLAGNPIVTLHDPEQIILTVTYGQGSMMSFQEKLTSQEIASILTYIRNSWGNQASPVDSRQVH